MRSGRFGGQRKAPAQTGLGGVVAASAVSERPILVAALRSASSTCSAWISIASDVTSDVTEGLPPGRLPTQLPETQRRREPVVVAAACPCVDAQPIESAIDLGHDPETASRRRPGHRPDLISSGCGLCGAKLTVRPQDGHLSSSRRIAARAHHTPPTSSDRRSGPSMIAGAPDRGQRPRAGAPRVGCAVNTGCTSSSAHQRAQAPAPDLTPQASKIRGDPSPSCGGSSEPAPARAGGRARRCSPCSPRIRPRRAGARS